MGRRYSLRGISKNRVYTYKVASRIVGVSEAAFRKWPDKGMRVINDKRPHLVRGADLIEFLERLQAAKKRPMTKTQFYCLRCNAPRDALGGVVEYSTITDLTGRISGLCAVCGGKIGRFCKASDLAPLSASLTISFKAKVQA